MHSASARRRSDAQADGCCSTWISRTPTCTRLLVVLALDGAVVAGGPWVKVDWVATSGVVVVISTAGGASMLMVGVSAGGGSSQSAAQKPGSHCAATRYAKSAAGEVQRYSEVEEAPYANSKSSSNTNPS